jgi:hypothetical protein
MTEEKTCENCLGRFKVGGCVGCSRYPKEKLEDRWEPTMYYAKPTSDYTSKW